MITEEEADKLWDEYVEDWMDTRRLAAEIHAKELEDGLPVAVKAGKDWTKCDSCVSGWALIMLYSPKMRARYGAMDEFMKEHPEWVKKERPA